MSQQNQRSKIIRGLVGAMGGSILIGLPALAQTNDPHYNFNIKPLELNSNTPVLSGDRISQANPNVPVLPHPNLPVNPPPTPSLPLDAKPQTRTEKPMTGDRITPDNSNSNNRTLPELSGDRMSPANPNSQVYPQSTDGTGSPPYNSNGERFPNDNSRSPDRNNPGLNQSPENRLSPSNTYQNFPNSNRERYRNDNKMSPANTISNPAVSPIDQSGYNGSNRRMNGGMVTPSDMNQRRMNRDRTSPDNSNRPSLNQQTAIPAPEQLQPPSASIRPMNGKVNVRLMNTTGATITYQVIGETKPRMLAGKSDFTLQGLKTPVTITFRRPDGGLVRVNPQPDSEPGTLLVSFSQTTNLSADRLALRINETGEVRLN